MLVVLRVKKNPPFLWGIFFNPYIAKPIETAIT